MKKLLLFFLPLLLFTVSCDDMDNSKTDKDAEKAVNKIFLAYANDLRDTLVDAVEKMQSDKSTISQTDYGVLTEDQFNNDVERLFDAFKRTELKGKQLEIYQACQALRDDYMSYVSNHQLGINGDEKRLAQFNIDKIKLDRLLNR